MTGTVETPHLWRNVLRPLGWAALTLPVGLGILILDAMYRSQFTHRFPGHSSLVFHRGHRCAIEIPLAWALPRRQPRHLARLIRAENHNSGNRISAADIGLAFNIAGIERHNAFRYRGKPLAERQVRLVRNMRVRMRRR